MDARGKTQFCVAHTDDGEQEQAPESGTPMLQYLIVVRGGIPGTMLRLVLNASSLGRSVENTYQLHDSTISRRHAVISVDVGGSAWITDLGSTNGTFVEGRRIPAQTPVRVKDGCRIQVGSSTLLKYVNLDPCEEGFQREMYERSVRDDLTELYNRGYFLNQVGPLAELNGMCELGLAVILVDIDRFKLINDTHGHDVGDQVLRRVAQILRESTRSEDLVARYGGEEFILALPIGTMEHARERAERIRHELARRCIDVSGTAIPVTASLGLAFKPPGPCQDLTAIISAADRALYEAKRGGRNRVACARQDSIQAACKTESADAFVMA